MSQSIFASSSSFPNLRTWMVLDINIQSRKVFLTVLQLRQESSFGSYSAHRTRNFQSFGVRTFSSWSTICSTFYSSTSIPCEHFQFFMDHLPGNSRSLIVWTTETLSDNRSRTLTISGRSIALISIRPWYKADDLWVVCYGSGGGRISLPRTWSLLDALLDHPSLVFPDYFRNSLVALIYELYLTRWSSTFWPDHSVIMKAYPSLSPMLTSLYEQPFPAFPMDPSTS